MLNQVYTGYLFLNPLTVVRRGRRRSSVVVVVVRGRGRRRRPWLVGWGKVLSNQPNGTTTTTTEKMQLLYTRFRIHLWTLME
jgi:hypothetical protein